MNQLLFIHLLLHIQNVIKRWGFPETKKNPIEDLKFDQDQWFCYPAKVGDLLCFVYFNVAYMAQGVTLCNLFQLATEEEYRNRKPDMIYVYGYEDGKNINISIKMMKMI